MCLLDTSTVPQGDTAILLSCLFSIYIKRRGQWIEIFCHKVFLSSQISIPLNYWRSLSGENAGEPKSWKGLDGGVKFYKLTCSFEIITDLMTPSVKEVVSYNSSRTARAKIGCQCWNETKSEENSKALKLVGAQLTKTRLYFHCFFVVVGYNCQLMTSAVVSQTHNRYIMIHYQLVPLKPRNTLLR